MKKIKYLLITLVLLLSAVMLSSCEKNLGYQICGYYIELNDVEEMNVSDSNPKIYFKYSENNMFSTKGGSGGSYFLNSTKTIKVEDEIKKYFFSADLMISKFSKEKIDIHLIILKDGEYVVESAVHKTISGTGKCAYSVDYEYEGQKYHNEFTINIKYKG